MSNTSDIETALGQLLELDESVLRSSGSPSFGITIDGFVAKSFVRLLGEKLVLARQLLDADIDLTSGSAIRKLLELSAVEDARTWAALAAMYDNCFIHSASGDALSLHGKELGIERPFMEATGKVTLKLVGELPDGLPNLNIVRGARMLTDGGHHVATDEGVTLSPSDKEREIRVRAFYPGPEGNLDPTHEAQVIKRWNRDDDSISIIVDAESAGAPLVQVTHNAPLSGGEELWPDERYRKLLMRAPRSLWTVEAIRLAAGLVPGVRHVQVHDPLGGLDIYQSIFGNFNFIDRVFGTERDLASPYYFTVMVAPTPAAIWDGAHGLRYAVESAIEDLRPLGIFPEVKKATEVFVGVQADLVVTGVPLPSGPRATVNGSIPAQMLKSRLLARIRRYIDGLEFGEHVSAARVNWELLNEPCLADVQNFRLLRYPSNYDTRAASDLTRPAPQEPWANIPLMADEIAVFVDDASGLTIV